jgi:hypothetical protein
MKKKWWKSKTLWLNATLAATTVAEANLGLLQSHFGNAAYIGLISAAAAGNAVLRFITTEPIGK